LPDEEVLLVDTAAAEEVFVARVVGAAAGVVEVGATANGVVEVGSAVVWRVEDALLLFSWMKTAPGAVVADSEAEGGSVAAGAGAVAGASVLEGVAAGVLSTTTGVPLIVVVPIATGRPVSYVPSAS